MKCPQCSFAISSNRDACPRCKLDLSEFKRRMGVKTSRVPVKRRDASSEVENRGVPQQQEPQATNSSFSAAVDALETMDAQPSAQASAGQKEQKPKDDISDLLDALGELRENSLSSFGGLQEVQFEEAQLAKDKNDSWRDEDSLIGASQVTEEQTPDASIEGSLFGGVEEARHATENLAQGFTQSEEYSGEEPEVTPAVEKAPEENRPLPKATATGSFPAQSVTPEVLDFSESDDQFEEHLDAMIGDLVFDVEAVRTEKKEVRPQSDSSMMFDDMEISIEIEVDDEDEEDEEQEEVAEAHDLEATQAFPAQSSVADDSFDDILASFNELESGTQEHSMAPDALASDSSGKSPTVHEPLLGTTAQPAVKSPQASSKALPDSVRATLRAARTQEDPSVKRLAALLAEAYGVNLDEFEELETIDSLEEELNHELGELLSEGTTFYGVNEAAPQSDNQTTQSGATTGDPELLALEGELLSELEALRQEGITLSGVEEPHAEESTPESEAVEPEKEAEEELPDELRALSEELDTELEELLGAQDLVEMANQSEIAHEVAEELDLLASHDDTADELVALSSELSEELAQLESSTQQHELADIAPNTQEQHSEETQAEDATTSNADAMPQQEASIEDDELGKTDTHEVDAISLAQHILTDDDLPVARVVTPQTDAGTETEAPTESPEMHAEDELVTVQTGQFFVADLERVTDEHTSAPVDEQPRQETIEVTTEDSAEEEVPDESQNALVQTGQFLVSDLDRLSDEQSTSSTLEHEDIDESSQEAAQDETNNDSLEDFINEVSFDDTTQSDEPTSPEVALTGQFFAEDLAQIEHGAAESQHEAEHTTEEAQKSEIESDEQFATQLTGQFFVEDLAQVSEAQEHAQQEGQAQNTTDTSEYQHGESDYAAEASEQSSSEPIPTRADFEAEAQNSLEDAHYTPAAPDEAPFVEDTDTAQAFDQAELSPVEVTIEEPESLPADEQAELASLDAELAALENENAASDEEQQSPEVLDDESEAVHVAHTEEPPQQIAEISTPSEQEVNEHSLLVESPGTEESNEHTQVPEGETPHAEATEGDQPPLDSSAQYTELDLLQQQLEALEYNQADAEEEVDSSSEADLAALQELKDNLAALAVSDEESASTEAPTNDAEVNNEHSQQPSQQHIAEFEAVENTLNTHAAQEDVEQQPTPDVEHEATALAEESLLPEEEPTTEVFDDELAELEAGLAELSAPSINEKVTLAQVDVSSFTEPEKTEPEKDEAQDAGEAVDAEPVSSEQSTATTEVDADTSAGFDPATTEDIAGEVEVSSIDAEGESATDNARLESVETGTFLTQDLDRLEENEDDAESAPNTEFAQEADSHEQDVVVEESPDEQGDFIPVTSTEENEIPVITRQDWQEVEGEVLTALSDEDAVFELSFGEIVAFQQNDRINVLFDSVDEEIVDPSKRKRHEVEVVNTKPKQLDNSSLNKAFTRFEQEAQQVAKQQAAERARGIDSFYSAMTQERAAAPRRAVAGVIDFISLVLLGLGISLLLFAPFELFKSVVANEPHAHFELLRYGFKVLLTCYLTWLIVGGITIASFGHSLGGKLMRLSVVTKEGDPLDIKRALLRSFASTMGIFTLGLSFLLPSLLRRRSFQDFIAHTEVIDGE